MLPCFGFGWGDYQLTTYPVDLLSHLECPGFKIQVIPLKGADLTPAQTCGHRGIEEIMPEFILFDGRHESVQLCFGQDFHGRAVKLGRVNFCRGIVGDQVLLHSRFQGVVQGGVNAVDRSGGKAGGLSISGMYPPGFL